MPGWLVATEGTITVALDIVKTPELVLEGTARELIHPIQNLRKESGFELTDRIDTVVYADGAAYDGISKALEAWGDYVASQTLSVSLELKPLSEAPAPAQEIAWEDSIIKLNLTKK